ncbi:zona pellucida sperm-binding protein 4 [Lynx canadensis]|uniref:zona pellucida sperm-binding protein 4 n=1 Tax=Lynx canadensis TaxID=61383 RepID=UPI0011B07FD1|nr:zona pellucida sperm-binding protein 4 [Lynx canadensis]
MWLLQPLLLCVPLSLTVRGQQKPQVPDYPGELHCGFQSLQFAINPSPGKATPALIAWDNLGLPHRLQNNSGCGTWVRESPGGSVLLEASYSSCYVTEWVSTTQSPGTSRPPTPASRVTPQDSHYVMIVGVEGTDAAGRRVTNTKVLRCPRNPPDQALVSSSSPSPLQNVALEAPNADLCDSVPKWDRLPCASSPITRGDCNKLGCCYKSEANSCYYGNTVTSRCTQDGHFSIAVSRNVTSPPLLLNSLRLAFGKDHECNPVKATRAFALFFFPFNSCGTTRWVTGDQAVYENELVAARDVRTWSHGSITRDSIFRLRVSCSYSVRSNAFPLSVQVFTIPPPHLKTQHGPLTLELKIAKDKHYGSYYTIGDYPVVKLLRDPIYVEVSIRHRTDPSLGLLLHNCWATPGKNSQSPSQWPILVKGCPYVGDNYQTQLIAVQKALDTPFPSYYKRFSIFTFSFVDTMAKWALRGPVYLHCNVSICQPAGTSSCRITCPVARRRRRSDLHLHSSTASISSKGPMILLQATMDSAEKLHKNSSSPMDSQALWMAGLSGTLIFGFLLVSYLAIRKRR